MVILRNYHILSLYYSNSDGNYYYGQNPLRGLFMSITISNGQVITGGLITGFTSPTYTVSDDVAPTVYGKQKAVTAIGGTQTNVLVHSAGSPFTVTFVRPSSIVPLGKINPATGLVMGAVTKNTYKIIIRKGVQILANNPAQLASVTVEIKVPAGADSYLANVDAKAMISFLVGVLNNQSAGIGDLITTGII